MRIVVILFAVVLSSCMADDSETNSSKSVQESGKEVPRIATKRKTQRVGYGNGRDRSMTLTSLFKRSESNFTGHHNAPTSEVSSHEKNQKIPKMRRERPKSILDVFKPSNNEEKGKSEKSKNRKKNIQLPTSHILNNCDECIDTIVNGALLAGILFDTDKAAKNMSFFDLENISKIIHERVNVKSQTCFVPSLWKQALELSSMSEDYKKMDECFKISEQIFELVNLVNSENQKKSENSRLGKFELENGRKLLRDFWMAECPYLNEI